MNGTIMTLLLKHKSRLYQHPIYEWTKTKKQKTYLELSMVQDKKIKIVSNEINHSKIYLKINHNSLNLRYW